MVGLADWSGGWGCVMLPMAAWVSGPALSDSVIQAPVTVTGITPVALMPVMELSQFLRSRRSRASGLPPHQEYFTAGGIHFMEGVDDHKFNPSDFAMVWDRRWRKQIKRDFQHLLEIRGHL
jgi:hypothetical protein